jgi:hypothetical protein
MTKQIEGPYSLTITLRHDGADLEVCNLRSETPFLAMHVGHFIESGCLPPLEPRANRYRIVDVSHSTQLVGEAMRHYIHVHIEPA